MQSANASAVCVRMLGLQVGAEPAATATSKKASKGKKTGGTKGGAAGAGAGAAVEASDAAKSDPRFKVCCGQKVMSRMSLSADAIATRCVWGVWDCAGVS